MNPLSSRSSSPLLFENALDLERYVAALYYSAGYQVFVQGGGFGPGEGVDLVVVCHGLVTVVRCKHEEAEASVSEMRELLGAMVDFRARRAGFVSTSGFSEDAVRFSLRNKIELIDSQMLSCAIERFYGWTPFHEAFDCFSKRCPKCGGNLVKREHRDSGEFYWVCWHYPQCDHTERLDHNRVVEFELEEAC